MTLYVRDIKNVSAKEKLAAVPNYHMSTLEMSINNLRENGEQRNTTMLDNEVRAVSGMADYSSIGAENEEILPN